MSPVEILLLQGICPLCVEFTTAFFAAESVHIVMPGTANNARQFLNNWCAAPSVNPLDGQHQPLN
jgi:hypothetical protein